MGWVHRPLRQQADSHRSFAEYCGSELAHEGGASVAKNRLDAFWPLRQQADSHRSCAEPVGVSLLTKGEYQSLKIGWMHFGLFVSKLTPTDPVPNLWE
jgi:hypothetical protein